MVVNNKANLPRVLRNLESGSISMATVIAMTSSNNSSKVLHGCIGIIPPNSVHGTLITLSRLSRLRLRVFRCHFGDASRFLTNRTVNGLVVSTLTRVGNNSVFTTIRRLSSLVGVEKRVCPIASRPLALGTRFASNSALDNRSRVATTRGQVRHI